jgi:hypothetical protein
MMHKRHRRVAGKSRFRWDRKVRKSGAIVALVAASNARRLICIRGAINDCLHQFLPPWSTALCWNFLHLLGYFASAVDQNGHRSSRIDNMFIAIGHQKFGSARLSCRRVLRSLHNVKILL